MDRCLEVLSRILEQDESRFRSLERRAADVIEVITNVGMKYKESEENIDVCQAIKEMQMESEKNGELKKAQETSRNMYEMGDGIEKISKCVGYAVETVSQWLGLPVNG